MTKAKQEKEIFYTQTELAKKMGITKQALTKMRKQGHLPKTRLLSSLDPRVIKALALAEQGLDITGKANTYQKNKLEQKRIEKESETEEEKLKAKAERLLSESKTSGENKYTGTADLDELCERLKHDLCSAPTEGIGRQISQTMVDLERFKKLQIETSQKKGEVIPRESVRWFFNKYFNSLNESLIELPSVSLANKILGEIRMLEKRPKPKTILKKFAKKLAKTKPENIEDLIDKTCEELSTKATESEIKIKVQDIIQSEISTKIKSTHEALKQTKYFKNEHD